MTESLYDRLGVAPTSSAAEIRTAYLKLARIHHPDFHTNDADRLNNEREMQSINEAWAVLGDPERRRVHDERMRLSQPDHVATGTPVPGRYDFVPFDDSDDEIDPRLIDDVGVEGTHVARSVQIAPLVCFGGGVLGVILGVVINLPFLIAVGAVGLVLSVFGFLLAPVIALSRSIRAERDR